MEDKLLILRFKRGSMDALCRIYEKYEGVMLTVAGHPVARVPWS